MNCRKSITVLFCLAGLLTVLSGINGAVWAQDQTDPLETVARFLPEGASMRTATKAEIEEAVEKAVGENPALVVDIVRAASAERPDAVTEIVNAAVRAVPEEVNAICFAAGESAPERAMDIPACQDALGAAVRLEGLPVTKPLREEPSPSKPR